MTGDLRRPAGELSAQLGVVVNEAWRGGQRPRRRAARRRRPWLRESPAPVPPWRRSRPGEAGPTRSCSPGSAMASIAFGGALDGREQRRAGLAGEATELGREGGIESGAACAGGGDG